MKEETVEKIMKRIINAWTARLPKGAKLSEDQLYAVRAALSIAPDDDGLKRVQSLETGKVHLVPYEHIILNGLKGSELEKFPEEKNENFQKQATGR